ncbi:MAG: M20/M25/M40 family metallo-hydrolase [Phycisphaeraceae bacterium]|nr:M20/M25/M40 family metallo-hydrolase [Phycisphaeraceae bacterium]
MNNSKAEYHRLLLELTGIPTGPACEGRIVAWVEAWCADRAQITLDKDDAGNLHLSLGPWTVPDPVILEAHMDHPAFVALEAGPGDRRLWAEFRGGVGEPFFAGSRVMLHATGSDRPIGGSIAALHASGSDRPRSTTVDEFHLVEVELDEPMAAQPGDLLTWDVGPSRIVDSRLVAPACDDLAAVAAALAALDQLRHDAALRGKVGVVLTRAEEIGFIGALALCRSQRLPPAARIFALENSRSYAESPIGGGPIIRVGDKSSTFDPALTRVAEAAAAGLERQSPGFRYQRKLMPGGTCEATAFCEYGYAATCLCLPLGNYHNMNGSDPDHLRIDAETISLDDFDGLLDLLIHLCRNIDDPSTIPPLRDRLDKLFRDRGKLLR